MHGSRCKPVLRKSIINEIALVRPEFTTSTYSCKSHRTPPPRLALLEQQMHLKNTTQKDRRTPCVIPKSNETNLGDRNQNSGCPGLRGHWLKRGTRQISEEMQTLISWFGWYFTRVFAIFKIHWPALKCWHSIICKIRVTRTLQYDDSQSDNQGRLLSD